MSDKKGSWFRKAMAGMKLRPPVFAIPEKGFEVNDVTVVNPGLERKEHQTITVKDSSITHITDFQSDVTAGSDQNPYAGYYALPGLIDMHVHYPALPSELTPATLDISEWAGPLFLAYGVTTVRDVGNFKTVWRLRKRMENCEFPCPRFFCCGPLLDGDPPRMTEFSWVIRNPEEGRDAVEKLADMNVDFVKVYDNLTPESLAAIRETAAKHSLQVVGHLPFKVKFEEAGINDLQHLWGIQFTSLHPGLDFNNPEHFATFMKAWAGVDEAHLDNLVRISVDQEIAHTPTIVVQDRIARLNDPGMREEDTSQYLLPRFFRDLLWDPRYGVQYIQGHSEEVLNDFKTGVATMKKLVGKFHEAGVKIFAGTDGPYNPFTAPGFSLHEELYDLADGGLTPEEVWLAGTRSAGEYLGKPLLGTLQKDAPADILLFREDPTQDLSAMSTLELVVVDGRMYTIDTLKQAITDHKTYFDGWLYDRATVSIIRSTLKKIETK